jgi:hypothetical protein
MIGFIDYPVTSCFFELDDLLQGGFECTREYQLADRLHSVPPAKRQEDDDQRSIDEEALAGPDGPPPPRLTPEWVAVNLMDITAHLMAAIDKAAGPLDRLADAAEDATAHVAHASRVLRKPLTIIAIILIATTMIVGTYAMTRRGHWNSAWPYESDVAGSSAIRLGGVEYPLDRKSFEQRLAKTQPEAIHKYYVEIAGRKFPVKQAVSVGLRAPRASFRTDSAIHALTKLGYQTKEAAE